MTWLLDTNICIELMNERDSHAARKLASVSPHEVRLCAVVKAELHHGACTACLILLRSTQ